jgi:subtilisin family serine protease
VRLWDNVSFNDDPGAVMPTKIDPHIKKVVADKKVTAEEWDREIAPNLEKRPKATPESRAILQKLWGKDGFEIEQGALESMEQYLRGAGYPMPYDSGMPRGMTVKDLMAGNVSETDRDFEKLVKLAGRNDAKTLIAVLDGGMEIYHPALEEKIWTNPGEIDGNGVDDDGNGLVDDAHGWDFVDGDFDVTGGDHGSHVSGIATRGTKRIEEIPVRAFSPLTTERLTQALEYACANGARVVNMSFKVDKPEMVEAAKALMAKYPQVLFVKSAGNDGSRIDPEESGYAAKTYLPTNLIDNRVVVSSCDAAGRRAETSNYGAPFSTVAARGHDVYSTVPGRTFAPMDGTSMAAPNVTSLAAKCLTLAPRLTPADLKKIMVETSDTYADWRDLTVSGGLVNDARALKLAALVSLTDGGMEPEAAAKKLKLDAGDREKLLALLPSFVRPATT